MLFSLQEQPVREEMEVDWVSGQVAWGLPYLMSKGTVVTALDSQLLLQDGAYPGSSVAGTELIAWLPHVRKGKKGS